MLSGRKVFWGNLGEKWPTLIWWDGLEPTKMPFFGEFLAT